MARKNQMIGLMQLAWNWCEQDFKYVFAALCGAVFAFGIFAISYTMLFSEFQSSVNFVLPSGSLDMSSVIVLCAAFGLIKAISFILFLLIFVCLADYALTFISVCYHYDNKNWESAKIAIRMGKTINTLWNNFIDGYIALVKKNRNDIQNKIKESEKELDEEILQLKFDAEL